MDLVKALIAISTEAASNTVGTVYKLTTDTATTVAKIANDSAHVALKITEDTASTVVKIAGDSVATFAKVVSDSVGTANKMANNAGGTAKQIFRGEITSIPEKLLHDSLEIGAKIVADTTGSLAKIMTDTASTASKVASDLTSTGSDVINASLSTGGKIVSDTDTSILKVGDDSLETAVHAASRVLSSRAANAFLKYVTDVFNRAGDVEVVDAILQLMQRSLEAVGRSLSGAAIVWKGIFTNGTNEAHLRFILDHLYDLFRFLYDVGRPGTVISESGAIDGAAKNGGDVFFPGSDNPYNELDLRLAENQYAIINQVQRVVKTLVKILKMGRRSEGRPGRGLDDLQMDISLRNDFDEDGNPMPPTYLSKLKENQPSRPDETWLVINGMALEYVWFQRTCDKIRDAFKREVKGVYNRTDGILWDLIECFGEHSSVKRNELIERTQSSRAAQAALELELRNALPDDGPAPDKVVVIAHSQGCLVLRLALQTLITETAKGSQRRRNIKQRLRVFTFASPAIDWRVLDGDSGERSLSEYMSLTEHYAHEADFVAVLGVVTHRADRDSGYDEDSVFLSKGGRGHLFGAHYPLRAEAYKNGDKSKLFKALRGDEIA